MITRTDPGDHDADRRDHDADLRDHDADRRDHDADLRDHDGPIWAITMGRFPHDKRYRAAMEQARADLVEDVAAFRDEVFRRDDRERLERVARAVDAYVQVLDRMLAIPSRPSGDLVLLFESDILPRQKLLSSAMAEVIAPRKEFMVEAIRWASEISRDALRFTPEALVLGLLASAGFDAAPRTASARTAERRTSQITLEVLQEKLQVRLLEKIDTDSALFGYMKNP
ncbi:hypothetical protein OV203_38545 [Nannocystis sp. ILAH1]|uniref:hypothetical protein n=1 Tax=Nannocystis sp. ILAH1 TaxID=2996789 RepID=UPI00226D82DC|nr:hypothetical protein [Nannocystis sp. ILAH1]MCY0993104.1 hypothetical protein [Nannocystis sp. ILAH1]